MIPHDELDRLLGSGPAAVRAVADKDALLTGGRDPAVEPRVCRADRAVEAALWKRLSAARNAFNKRRKAYFAPATTMRPGRRSVPVGVFLLKGADKASSRACLPSSPSPPPTFLFPPAQQSCMLISP